MEIVNKQLEPRKPRRKRWTRRERIMQARLATPSVRMVVIEVRSETADDQGQARYTTTVHSVVSVESRVVETFSRRDNEDEPEDYPDVASRAELVRDGFDLTGRNVKFGAVLLHVGIGQLVGLLDLDSWGDIRSAYRLLACPWPPTDDESRLATVIAELQIDAARLASGAPAR